MDWTVWGSDPGGARDFLFSFQAGPWAHPASSVMGAGAVQWLHDIDHPPVCSAKIRYVLVLYLCTSSLLVLACYGMVLVFKCVGNIAKIDY